MLVPSIKIVLLFCSSCLSRSN